LQAQGFEFVVTQRAGKVAFELVAVLRSPVTDELAVKVGILIHGVLQSN
jgi:hypothetical protein